MHLSYKKQIFLYFLLVFSIFTVIIIAVQQNREKTYKEENFKTNLNAYAEVIAHYINQHQLLADHHIDSVRCILPLLPPDLRVSVINRQGSVLFDNEVKDSHQLNNHLSRPEISRALTHQSGTHIRQSETTGKDFYYYAHYFNPYFIRVALPYNYKVQNTLKADEIFTYFILLLFFTTLISLLYLADRFGKAISGLNDFIISAENNDPKYEKIKFPETELGEIGNKIVTNYKMLEESKNQLNLEREKILRHFHHSDEGICIFSADRKKIYANTHFIQYLNTIMDEPTFEVEAVLKAPEFKELESFLLRNTPVNPQAKTIPIWQGKISKNGKHFAVRLVIFYDNSYEIILNNISSSERNRLLKQEMTNNIAHELKTPVSSIRGYIETILEQEYIEPVKQKFFLERAYSQILRLSDLIRDVALITKTEEASELFEKESINIRTMIQEVTTDLEVPLQQNRITVENRIGESVEMEGNRTLLYSIFRNLIDNTISYAGENVTIGIENYAEDNEFYYFSYNDNGHGVGEEHLERIFDRFYRVDPGRSRKSGGSGLGLSIVKNAVMFHKGQITAKNRKEGGLEFIFSLRKKFF
ncbi:MAG: HAMP domain-containing sensor histidine kinase [Odoribacter sp.]